MIKKYGILGSFRLFVSLIYTKLFFRKARLIRLPFDIRNRSSIHIGDNFTCGFSCRIEAYPEIENEITLVIGNNVEINDFVHISSRRKVFIGDNVLIASKVFITDLNHGSYSGIKGDSPNVPPSKRKLNSSDVIIENNVWIGEGVCVLPGVKIGQGSIIGALSVVSKDIPSNSIAVGTPARVIKKFDSVEEKWKLIEK